MYSKILNRQQMKVIQLIWLNTILYLLRGGRTGPASTPVHTLLSNLYEKTAEYRRIGRTVGWMTLGVQSVRAEEGSPSPLQSQISESIRESVVALGMSTRKRYQHYTS